MSTAKNVLNTGFNTKLVEWPDIDNTDSEPDYIAVPERAEMTVQLMELVSGTPTMGVEYSLNLDADVTKVWGLAKDPSDTTIALTVAGTGATILESGVLMRLRVTAGTGAARGRIKFTRIK